MQLAVAVLILSSVAHGARIQTTRGTSPDGNARKLLQSSPDGYSPCLGPDYKLLWSDEFNDESTPLLDSSKWSAVAGDGCQLDLGLCNWGNNEQQYYTNRTANVYVQDGRLVIQAQRESGEQLDWLVAQCFDECGSRCERTVESLDYLGDCIHKCSHPRCDNIRDNAITSARITTSGKFSIAPSADFPTIRVEASINLSNARFTGSWPAFWMLSEPHDNITWPSSGEIDIMEARNNDVSALYGTAFFGGTNDVRSLQGQTGPALDGYQTFAVEWDADQLRWYVDGHLYHTIDSAAKLAATAQQGNGWFSADSPGTNAPFNSPFYIILNLAVGGWFPAMDAASVKADLGLNARQMEIDYVRVCGKPAAV